MHRMLGISDLAAYGDLANDSPSGLGGAMAGIMAVGSGACDVALVFRSISQNAGYNGSVQNEPLLATGTEQFLWPYGVDRPCKTSP